MLAENAGLKAFVGYIPRPGSALCMQVAEEMRAAFRESDEWFAEQSGAGGSEGWTEESPYQELSIRERSCKFAGRRVFRSVFLRK